MNLIPGVGLNDTSSGSVVSEELTTYYVHQGKSFTHSGKTAIANGATDYHFIKANAGVYPHIWQIFVQADASPLDVYLFEGSTVTVNGTLQVPVNTNRNSATVSGVSVYNGATVTVDGTQIDYFLVAGSKQSGGIGNNNGFEINLIPNTNYTLKIVNNSGGAANVGVYIGWFELNS